VTADTLEAAAARMPDWAETIGVIDLSVLARSDDASVVAALGALSQEQLGLDVTKARRIEAFAARRKGAAVRLVEWPGKLPPLPDGVYGLRVGDDVLLGDKSAVEAARRPARSLAQTPAWWAHEALATRLPAKRVVAMMTGSARAMPYPFNADSEAIPWAGAAVTPNRLTGLWLGEPRAHQKAQQRIQRFLKSQHRRLGTAPFGAARFEAKQDAVIARVEGSLSGVIAATLEARRQHHLRLALTQEAIDNLEAAFEGFKAHITAQKAPCVMPKAVELTPQGSACDHPDKKFPANEGAWDHPTWRTLGFAPKGQHRYRYRFEPHPDGNMPRFTVAAHGDLDCDGTLSTFERYGYMDTPAEDGSCRMRGSSAFYKDMETE